MTVTKCHNFEFVTSVTRSGFFLVFLAEQICSHFGHKCHKCSNSNVTGKTRFLFLFRLKLFGMNEIRKNIPESELCFCFLFGVRIGTALTLSWTTGCIFWLIATRGPQDTSRTASKAATGTLMVPAAPAIPATPAPSGIYDMRYTLFDCHPLCTLQHTEASCSILQHTAAYCNTLQHTATHCNTLQHTATRCNTLQHTAIVYHVHTYTS